MTSTGPDFDRRAASYDRLRPQGAAWWRRFDALVERGSLRGRRVLDVGCGTGALAVALAEKAHCRVWAVDVSPAMVEITRGRLPRGAAARCAPAERLPFRDASFERVTMSLVVHLVDRPAAFAEAARVLEPEGVLVIGTFAPSHFDTYWAAPFFPSIRTIDRERFPSPDDLLGELGLAGFEKITMTGLLDREPLEREIALERIRGRHISTFDLLEERELAAGTARAEAELAASVEVILDQLIVTGRLPRTRSGSSP